jgi:hypothetical protein
MGGGFKVEVKLLGDCGMIFGAGITDSFDGTRKQCFVDVAPGEQRSPALAAELCESSVTRVGERVVKGSVVRVSMERLDIQTVISGSDRFEPFGDLLRLIRC